MSATSPFRSRATGANSASRSRGFTRVRSTLRGARMVTHFGLAPILDGMGIIHPIFSYCGQITVSFTACREMMPDPDFYAECIQASFDELKAATTGATVTPIHKPAAGPRRKTSTRKAADVAKTPKRAAKLTA